VHAFEPNPQLVVRLKQIIDRNRLANVTLHPVAHGAEAGTLELRIPKHNAGAASLVRNRGSPDCESAHVPVRTLSGEGIPQARLIKIDVEGYEVQVFRGASFASFRPEAILFEIMAIAKKLTKAEKLVNEQMLAMLEWASDRPDKWHNIVPATSNLKPCDALHRSEVCPIVPLADMVFPTFPAALSL